MYTRSFLLVVFVFLVVVAVVTSEGISHASHLMLKASENGDTEAVINYITKTGVPINVKNNYGVSAIIFAANNGHRDLVKALVEVGANIEDRSNNWKTPLNWAAHWGHYDCVEYLVGAGANISTFDSKGMTPLMSATLNGNARIVQFLLDHGASPITKNVYNGTALSIARVRNDTMLISMLEPYYPPEPESSPYMIMYNNIASELENLMELVVKESYRIWVELQPYLLDLQQEGTKLWEQIKAKTAPATVADTQACSLTQTHQTDANEMVDSGECVGNMCTVEQVEVTSEGHPDEL